MLTTEGLSEVSLWNTSLRVRPTPPRKPPTPWWWWASLSGSWSGVGERLSLCWKLSRSRLRLVLLSDFLASKNPSLLCLVGVSSDLSWHSLRRKSINLIIPELSVSWSLLPSQDLLLVFSYQHCFMICKSNRLVHCLLLLFEILRLFYLQQVKCYKTLVKLKSGNSF